MRSVVQRRVRQGRGSVGVGLGGGGAAQRRACGGMRTVRCSALLTTQTGRLGCNHRRVCASRALKLKLS